MDQPATLHRTPRSPGTRSPRQASRTGLRSSPARPLDWDAYAAVCDATVGALQALAIIAGFVVFGLGWAILASASQPSARQVQQVQQKVEFDPLAGEITTRYRGEIRNPSFDYKPELHYGSAEQQDTQRGHRGPERAVDDRHAR